MKPEEIHIWIAALDRSEEELQILHALLSVEERARAERFLQEIDRRRFVTARAILRRLLGSYLGQQPTELRFSYGEKGKPRLKPDSGFNFSLSHSAGHALYALAWNRELGVDL